MKLSEICSALFLTAGLATVALAGGESVDAPAKKPVLGSYAGEVTASRLQLRAGPGEAYQAVATIKRGERVVVMGKHANLPEWVSVELPQGYHAWVFGSFLAVGKDGVGTVTTNRLLVRPRATTKFHQLAGRLNKGDTVKVMAKKETSEGLWYQIVVPRRFVLFAHSRFLKNIGAASLAEPKKGKAPAAPETDSEKANNRQFESLIKAVLLELPKMKTSAEVEPLRRAVSGFKPRTLSVINQNKRVEVLGKILKQEREFAISELTARENEINAELEKKLAEIEAKYQEKLRLLRDGKTPLQPRYVAVGIVAHLPDIFGRHPSFRLEKGKKMRFFLIAPNFDLNRFIGKRVGVVGLTDPESGTGYSTIMVKRIEILGDK